MNELGKIPPQAVDLEEAVLGQCLLEPNALMVAMGILKNDFFYKESHQKIFKAMELMAADKEPIDILTVTQKLKSMDALVMVGGPFYVSQLTNNIGTSANIDRHCRIVAEKFMKREIIRISSLAIQSAYEDSGDVFEIHEQLQKNTQNITKNIFANQAKTMADLTDQVLEDLNKVKETGESVEVIKTGITALDNVVRMKLGDNIVIAARPSMGKTTLALQISKNLTVLQGVPTLFFSLEMKDMHLIKNMMCMHFGIGRRKMQKGDISPEEMDVITSRIGEIKSAPLYVITKPGITITEMQAITRRYVYEFGVKVVIVDYLQRMKGTQSYKGNRDAEVTEISNGVKDIAMELDIVAIPLCQLSRSVEKRGGDKKPLLSDLRDSGSLEQDGDVVMFPHRPSYYDILTDGAGNDISTLAELVVRKNRDGSLDAPQLTWNDKVICFDDRGEQVDSDFSEDREEYGEAGGSDDMPF